MWTVVGLSAELQSSQTMLSSGRATATRIARAARGFAISNRRHSRPAAYAAQAAASAASAAGMATAALRTAAVEGMEPSSVWKFFADLSQLPRPSKHEEK
jgi:hypothetical protein